MSYQVKAFQLSFLLHSLIIVVVVIGSTVIGPYKKEIILDLDFQKPVPDIERVAMPAPAPSVEKKFASPAIRQNMKEKEPSRPPEETPRLSSIPETPPVVKLPEIRNLETGSIGQGTSDTGKAVKERIPGAVGTAGAGIGTNTDIGIADGGNGAARIKYLKNHFAYIRDRILGNVNYPDAARRMGWRGKVVLSFIITADGSVRALKIIQSSGYKMLDNDAVESVQGAVPFPNPPVEAEIVIPITYHLK